MRQLIAGNWKMNGTPALLAEVEATAAALAAAPPSCDVLVCPPASLIAQAAWMAKGRVAIGAQDCHPEPSGAFTGDISAEMLRDAGARAIIVGHSERRQYHGESDALVAAKARAAWRAGLLAIVCVGETEAERDAGGAHGVCAAQLAGSVPEGARGEGGGGRARRASRHCLGRRDGSGARRGRRAWCLRGATGGQRAGGRAG